MLDLIFLALATEGKKPERIMIDAIYLGGPPAPPPAWHKGAFPVVWGEPREVEFQAACRLRRGWEADPAAPHRRTGEWPQGRQGAAWQAPSKNVSVADIHVQRRDPSYSPVANADERLGLPLARNKRRDALSKD